MRFAAIAVIAAFSLSAIGASAATQCKDAKGKFIKCPPPAAAPATPAKASHCKDPKSGRFIKCAPTKPVKCKDAKGKFAKCDAPGAKPVT